MGSADRWSPVIVAIAGALAIVYVAPHVWWMFGISYGFPGDSTVFDTAFERTWFAIYNVVAIGLVLTGLVAIASLELRFARGGFWALSRLLVIAGAVLLLVRGGLGVVTSIPAVIDPTDETMMELAWEAWFVGTGSLYTIVARRNWWNGITHLRASDD